MADSSGFSSFVPGFDFLQSLVKNAGSALPSMGQWVVPTLDPAELERRIEELRTVQFWLDQNSRMLATTIQALEVQRMTLSALKGMNVSVSELHQAMQMTPDQPAASPRTAPPTTPPATELVPPESAASAAPAAPGGVVDAMQWWGALTQQFSQIANQAMQGAAQAAAPVAAPTPAAKAPAPAPAPRSAAAQSAPPKAAVKTARKATRAPRAPKPRS